MAYASNKKAIIRGRYGTPISINTGIPGRMDDRNYKILKHINYGKINKCLKQATFRR